MNNYWKIAFILTSVCCAVLLYLYIREKTAVLKSNQIKLEDINKEDYEYKKKQDPSFSQDLNDYFFKKQTEIRFLKDVYHLDTVKKGKIIRQDMLFVNTGKNPYFITDIKVSCGCTVPTYDKKPIQPGDTGLVKVEFNSGKKDEGFFMNKLSIYGNVKGDETMAYFDVYVKK